jgi:hypothetical protein
MAKNAFQDLLDTATLPGYNILPLVHDTSYKGFEKIIKSRHLEARRCKVFKKKLLYFFYGRSSYKVTEKVKESYKNMLLPACFIVKTDYIKEIYAVYPFDTGGYQKGLFSRYFTKAYNFEDFVLGNDINDALRFIGLFYESNRDYMLLKSKRVISKETIINEYVNLINAKDEKSFDERCSTIEVQVTYKVPILEALEAIIIPQMKRGDTCIQEIFNNKVTVLTYDAPVYLTPSLYKKCIIKLFNEYYRVKKGIYL